MNVSVGVFVGKYFYVFEIFIYFCWRNLCCRVSEKLRDLIEEEESVVREFEVDVVRRVKKLLLMFRKGVLNVYVLRLMRKELGLFEDFRDLVLVKYSIEFRLVDLEILELVDRDDDDESLCVVKVEEWREVEYREKWLSEFEMNYAFFINFFIGFKIEKGFREELRNW